MAGALLLLYQPLHLILPTVRGCLTDARPIRT
jgi:hypothetical protein